MRKILAVLCGIIFIGTGILPVSAYSQQDIYTAADRSLDWIINNASPLKTPDSATSDNCVMALSRINKSFDYNKYLSYTQSRNPSTDKDGQRLIMTETACGSVVSGSFVKLYTYDHMRDNADDLAGAIITLDSGGYEVNSDDISIDYMVMELLSMQQPDGSFGGNIYSTARAVIALSSHRRSHYDVTGSDENESYTYNTETSIANAVSYLAGGMDQKHGYGTLTNTAYVIIALDSVGINAETDSRFASGSVSPISFLLTQQGSDGSFNSSADDTALVACALVSHIRSLQGKAPFFSFRSGDIVTDPGTESVSTSVDNPETRPIATSAPKKTDPPIVKLTPLPTKVPEHSELKEEEYGPFAPVGPIKPYMTEKPYTENVGTELVSTSSIAVGMALKVIAVIFVLVGAAWLFISIKYPDRMNAVIMYIKKKILRLGNDSSGSADIVSSEKTNDTPEDLYVSEPAFSTEELYDPDFVKKLVPVDELDDELGDLIQDKGFDDEE